MKINDLIFNEMQEVHANPMSNEYFADEILPQIKEQEEDISDLSFWYIPFNSLLWRALVLYYGNYDKATHSIRSAVTDEEGIYFATGGGYDIISADLLNGQADGQAKQDVLEFINKTDK